MRLRREIGPLPEDATPASLLLVVSLPIGLVAAVWRW